MKELRKRFQISYLARHCVKENPVKEPCSTKVLVAQWLEHPTGVREVMGSIVTSVEL